LIVSNGEEAIDLLTKSKRIYYDLTNTLLLLPEKLKKNGEHILENEKIVIRKFFQNIEPEVLNFFNNLNS
jgi:hypothetical protein